MTARVVELDSNLVRQYCEPYRCYWCIDEFDLPAQHPLRLVVIVDIFLARSTGIGLCKGLDAVAKQGRNWCILELGKSAPLLCCPMRVFDYFDSSSSGSM